MRKSEFKCLALLESCRKEELSQTEAYRACVALANNGIQHGEEEHLSHEQRILLGARRLIRAGGFKAAEQTLHELGNLSALFPDLEADRRFLLATLAHLRGDQRQGAERMDAASQCYGRAGDEYRALRAMINGMIGLSDLANCLSGPLWAFEQEARRSGYYDLVGAIQRTRAIELLRATKHSAAIIEARAAAVSYELDGCPQERGLALSIAAIASHLSGDYTTARELRDSILVEGSKLESYVSIYDELVQGRAPKVLDGHPLAEINWKRAMIKPNSVPGKIIARLRTGPATRDELILAVWGAGVGHPSYQHRLHSALNTMKTNGFIQILFDGERYHIA